MKSVNTSMKYAEFCITLIKESCTDLIHNKLLIISNEMITIDLFQSSVVAAELSVLSLNKRDHNFVMRPRKLSF